MTLKTDKLMMMGGNNNTEENTSKRYKMEGLYDKNSDKQYAPRQHLPQSDYDTGHKEIFERCITKYRKLLDGAKEGIKWK